MKHILFIFFITFTALAQKTFVIENSMTKEPIAFTSIYTEDGTFKISAETDGNFTIPTEFLDYVFVFEAVGYDVKKTKLTTEIVLLDPKSELLDEVVIVSKTGARELEIGRVKKIIPSFSFIGVTADYILTFGRFFPYEEKYKETPYLKNISFLLGAEKKDATFGIKIYEANKEGKPVVLLHDHLIISKTKKGYKKTLTDVSDFNILFPKNGIVVVFEWIKNPGNLYEDRFDDKIKMRYNPRLYMDKSSNLKELVFKDSFQQKEWTTLDESTRDFFWNLKFETIMCQITLSN